MDRLNWNQLIKVTLLVYTLLLKNNEANFEAIMALW